MYINEQLIYETMCGARIYKSGKGRDVILARGNKGAK